MTPAALAVGVVGVGALGRHHARHLAALGSARLVGVYDVLPERAAEVAGNTGTQAMPSLDALLEAASAVTVAVPTPVHAEVGRRVLERGRHLLMEKPLAATVAEADELVRLAAGASLVLQTGHVERFNAAVRAAGPYLDGPRFIESDRVAPFQPRGADVAVTLDLMIHDLDLVLSLVREPVVEVRASGVGVLTPHVDLVNARLTFASGAVANLTASRLARERVRRLRIFQPSGYFSLDLAAGTGEFLRLRPDAAAALSGGAATLDSVVERIVLDAPGGDPLRLELLNFVAAAQGQEAPAVSGADGREALALAMRVAEALAAGATWPSPALRR